MRYPLVRELADDGIPVAVTCRVLKIARQPYYRWLACPVTYAELEQAHLANALFDAHRDDPEFGYRFLADEARDAEVGSDLLDRLTRLTTASDIYDVLAELIGIGLGHGRHPSSGASQRRRSVVTYPCSRPG